MEYDFVFDIETDGFRATLLHSLVIQCHQTGETFSFADQPGFHPISAGIELLETGTHVIGHNALGFDVPWLRKLRGAILPREKIIDTLTCARLLWPDLREADEANLNVPIALRGKHSLEAWGYRRGIYKGAYGKTTDWRHWSPAMQQYCTQDVAVTTSLYQYILEAGNELL